MSMIMVVLMLAVTQATGQEPVAVVESVSGRAAVTASGSKEKAAVSSFDVLAAGASLEVPAGSRMTIFFWNGRHYALDAGARSTIAQDGLGRSTGPVRQLDPLPPIAKPAPIARNTATGYAAPSIRGGEIKDLSPRGGSAALPDAVTLSFSGRSGAKDAPEYAVILEDADGKTVFNTKTRSTSVAVPPGTLKPASSYSWRVKTADAIGTLIQGSANFVTLPLDAIAQRSAFAKAVGLTAENASALALMGDVDLRLGLLREAREELSAAMKLDPANEGVRRALDRAQDAASASAK